MVPPSALHLNGDHDHAEPSLALKSLPSGKLAKSLSAVGMQELLATVRVGERNTSRSAISATLHVNDVVAEYCLRHLEEKLKLQSDYERQLLQEVEKLPQGPQSGLLQFLHFAFGLNGKVSEAVVGHLRGTGVSASQNPD